MRAIIIFIATIQLGYILSFSEIYQSRVDPFQNEVNVPELIEKYSVNEIAAYGYTNNLNFYPEINSNFHTVWVNQHPFSHIFLKKDIAETPISKKSFMIICSNSNLCGVPANEILATNEILLKTNTLDSNYELIFEHSSDSNITNGFSNFAGSGKRRIFVKIFSY